MCDNLFLFLTQNLILWSHLSSGDIFWKRAVIGSGVGFFFFKLVLEITTCCTVHLYGKRLP